MAIASDETFRLDALRLADAQHALGAPAYTYLFTWQSPALDGRLGACHALRSRSCSTTSTSPASSC